MKPIIRIENLGKRYVLGKAKAGPATLREAVYDLAYHPFKDGQKSTKEELSFWALRDINIEIVPGEVVGIIGRNGAGKSTLLKILARVTEPTEGRVELYGRANSMLEVGTGFHPELTGRENIFVNGAILGLRTAEIEKLFDEIVAFAEMDKFLDTAVKHYSSGMYMRLAFAVAAHLDPDILIIDEVLSVGDAQFQKKCLGKVHDVARSGRTVLFVSHNLAAVGNLCTRGIVLDQGKLVFNGDQTDAITRYLDVAGKSLSIEINNRTDRSGTGEVKITAIEVRDLFGDPLNSVMAGQDIDICFYFETSSEFSSSNVTAGFMVRTQLDVPVFLQHNRLTGDQWDKLPSSGAFVCRIKKLPLAPANYRLGFSVMRGEEELDRIDYASELSVVEGDFYGSGEVPPATHGSSLVDARWRLINGK